jgi:hypothetical protein
MLDYVFQGLKYLMDTSNMFDYVFQGWIQDFKLGGGALKKIVQSGGRLEKFWGISCEKSYFFQF